MKLSLHGIGLLVLLCVAIGVGLEVGVRQAVDSANHASAHMLYQRDLDQRDATVRGCERTNGRFALIVRFIHSTAHARRMTGYPGIAERYDELADEVIGTFPKGYVYGDKDSSRTACESAFPMPVKP